jgi:arylsulfatase A-like enzyme
LAKYKDKAPSPSVAKYWAMVEWFDETCGQLLDQLEKEKLAENTIVVYVTDNGWIQDPDGALSVRSKRTPYDAGLRTPILVRWPTQVKPRTSDELASSLDVVPTLLAALGLPAEKDLPGLNLLDESAVSKRKTLHGECFTHNAADLNDPAKSVRHRWIIDGNWKLIVPHVPADKDGPGEPELYDLAADPHEKANRIAGKPDVAAMLRKKLDDWWDPAR